MSIDTDTLIHHLPLPCSSLLLTLFSLSFLSNTVLWLPITGALKLITKFQSLQKEVRGQVSERMGSLGDDALKKKAMWVFPKVLGLQPCERWGHSACYFNGVVYVFGGCCGGLHFSDVLMLNLNTVSVSTLATTGQGPGPRDSHSAVLVGRQMFVFGGTNGSKKVNDLHVLDLVTKEWIRPECKGVPPCPRESHTATLVSNDRIMVFGGSGEGEANYLNDLHVLDLKTMTWSAPVVKGEIPVPRDSHSAIAIGSKFFVYGGDRGDRYHGDVDVLDTNLMTWAKLVVQGCSPGVRAGHTAVGIGSKFCVVGGVGDKHYYNDVWMLDLLKCSWLQLDICGQQPQGRFSHTAVFTDSGIVVYGGCGEDERPLNELLILQFGLDRPNNDSNISTCKIFGQHWSHKRSNSSKFVEIESEQEEHSLSLSQHSSPSQSDQEQMTVRQKVQDSIAATQGINAVKPLNQIPRKTEQSVHAVQNLIGADVRGRVDGAFDSGLLMTATVNGRLFRGVLFAPAPEFVASGAVSSPTNHIGHVLQYQKHEPVRQPSTMSSGRMKTTSSRSYPFVKGAPTPGKEPKKMRHDLQGVVLTLGPGSAHV